MGATCDVAVNTKVVVVPDTSVVGALNPDAGRSDTVGLDPLVMEIRTVKFSVATVPSFLIVAVNLNSRFAPLPLSVIGPVLPGLLMLAPLVANAGAAVATTMAGTVQAPARTT